MADMFGNSPMTILESALFTSVGGTITQIVVSSIGYVAAAGWALGDLIFNRGKGAWADMCNINWNPFNTNENKVMNSKYLSFYKGVPVLQVSEMGGSMSLGLIFFDKNQGIEVLKHERGYNIQLMSMGLCNYLIQEEGWEREKAREYVSSKFLAHGAGREDIKKIYLDS